MLTIIMIAENDLEEATEGGTFVSAAGGTFETVMPGTFHSAIGGTFETVLGGTIKPLPSSYHSRINVFIVTMRKTTQLFPYLQTIYYIIS